MPILTDKFDSFGLDIGDKSIKAAQIKARGKDFELKKYGAVELPDGVIKKGEVLKQKQVIKAIQKTLANATPKSIGSQYVHACLPETQTFIKLIKVPLDENNSLSARIKEELANHIPVEIEKSYIDWHIVDTDKQGNYASILAGAVPKKIANGYNGLLTQSSLAPLSFRIEAESIANALLPYEISNHIKPSAIVDIGATRSGFILLDKGAIQFSVSLPIAGNKMTQQISKTMNFTMQEAEKAKRTCLLESDNCEQIAVKIIKDEIKKLAQNINKNNSFYQEHFPNARPISNIILCGGGAYLPNLNKELGKFLPKTQVFLGKPLINLVKGRKSFFKNAEKQNLQSIYASLEDEQFNVPENFSTKHELSYATAIGLALSNVV